MWCYRDRSIVGRVCLVSFFAFLPLFYPAIAIITIKRGIRYYAHLLSVESRWGGFHLNYLLATLLSNLLYSIYTREQPLVSVKFTNSPIQLLWYRMHSMIILQQLTPFLVLVRPYIIRILVHYQYHGSNFVVWGYLFWVPKCPNWAQWTAKMAI